MTDNTAALIARAKSNGLDGLDKLRWYQLAKELADALEKSEAERVELKDIIKDREATINELLREGGGLGP